MTLPFQLDTAPGLSETLSASPLLAVATLFGAGVLTSLTPCVYPMIPITASVITGTARENQTRRRTLGLTLTYVVGMATLYAFLGLLAGLTGTLFGTVSASPWALLGIGNLRLHIALGSRHFPDMGFLRIDRGRWSEAILKTDIRWRFII